jgi:hypothetical protein
MAQVAVGNIQVGDNEVRLEVTLPWLLQRFGLVVQKTIAGKGRCRWWTLSATVPRWNEDATVRFIKGLPLLPTQLTRNAH